VRRIELFHGDITTLSADAIVNAANPQLTPGGAVGLAIHRAAGPELEAECRSLPRHCHPGDAVITGAYRLSAKYVIHAVGASWLGNQGEDEQLARTYRSCFALAEEHDVRTIAFPAISCGLYSFPAQLGAEIAIRETAAALERSPSIEKVTFALFTDALYAAFEQALSRYVARFRIAPCTDEAMFERLLALKDGFLVHAANMGAEELRARYRRCPSAFHCVMRGDDLVGYFILLPVNETCCDALRSGAIAAGRQIQLSDLAASGDEVAALYLSVVCAIGPRAQSAAIEGVIATLRELYRSENVRQLFARAATATGARMLERLSGSGFEADGRIHSIDLGAYDLITAPQPVVPPARPTR
jgi:O-acetyl-ADP-ribose deacetylase